MYDEYLKRHNLKYDDLTPTERETFHTMMSSVQQGQLTVEKIRDYITSMKNSVESELSTRKDSPQNFISLLTYFIPIIGIIRKWYQDQYEISLKARLRNLMLLEVMLSSPEKVRQQVERSLAGIAPAEG